MAKILAFAGSNSSASINFALIKYTVSLLDTKQHDIELLNMANLPFPMYSMDLEKEKGFSNALVEFKEELLQADGILISVNEHNGNPSAYFKNLLDWLSRLDRRFMEGSKIFLMSASGGKRGGSASLAVIRELLPRFGAEILETFSLPSFNINFDAEQGIREPELAKQHREALEQFLSKI